jgi:putative effector of murein hydrolase
VAELWLALTLLAYGVALLARRRWHTPLLQPTLVAMLLVAGVLLAAGVGYDRYAHGTGVISALLGPAVVAMAVPLHRERETLRRHGRALLLGAASGAASSAAFGLVAARLLHLAPAWALAVTSRSATSPVSIAVADRLHGTAALSATLSILTGVVGATIGPSWLNLIRVRDPLARGLAHGVTCHGIGTARMLEEGRVAGATATVGMGLGALLVAVSLPLLWR